MTSLTIILGGLLVFLAGGALFVYALPKRDKSRKVLFRPINSATRLKRAVGLAVEQGTRIHVSLGKSSLLSPTSASALVGLSTLERVTQTSLMSDQPPVATSGDGSISILSQDTLKSVYRSANAAEQYDPDQGRLAGATPMSYIAGALPIIYDENVSANLMVGNFGPEVALLTDAADRTNSTTVVASDSLPAQSVLYATSQDPLIGEELFALPAYLQTGSYHQASLQVQDLLRWVIIMALIGGAILKFLGFL